MQGPTATNPVAFKHLREVKEQLSGLESLPYNESLRSVMTPGVFTCPATATIRAVIQEISRRNISSALVVDDQQRLIGIFTDKDVVHRVVAAGRTDLDRLTVAEIMTSAPLTLHPDNTIYRALSILSRKGVKHLPLLENGRPAGIVTLRQLLKLKYPEPMVLIEEINAADNCEQLAKIRARLGGLAARHLEAGGKAYDIVAMLSLINQDLHTRTLDLIIKQLGPPPCPVCLYLTGSHGRRENLLNPDQDHGLIIADSGPEALQYSPYFIEFSTSLADRLHTVGFPRCTGHIMASNPLWRKSVAEWQLQIDYWLHNQVRELGRFLTILFDAAPVWGDFALHTTVREFAFERLKHNHNALRVLYDEASRHKPPVGLLGRFITERTGPNRGSLEIKRSGLLFMVEGVRILALMHGIRETSTTKRLEKLAATGHLHRDDGEYLIAAYHILLHLALKAQLARDAKGEEVNSFINPRELSTRERKTLRYSFKAISALQDLVASSFGQI